jgi:hypothetical protein
MTRKYINAQRYWLTVMHIPKRALIWIQMKEK